MSKLDDIASTRRALKKIHQKLIAPENRLSVFTPLLTALKRTQFRLIAALESSDIKEDNPVEVRVSQYVKTQAALSGVPKHDDFENGLVNEIVIKALRQSYTESELLYRQLQEISKERPQLKGLYRELRIMKNQLEAILSVLENRNRKIWPVGYLENDHLSLAIAIMPNSFKSATLEYLTIRKDVSLSTLKDSLKGPGIRLTRIMPPPVITTDFFEGVVPGKVVWSEKESATVRYPDDYAGGNKVTEMEIRRELLPNVSLADTYDENVLAEIFDGNNFIGLTEIWSEIASKTIPESITYLKDKVTERKSSLPVLGIKVPYSNLQVVAPVILIANLLYLLGNVLHLSAIRTSKNQELITFPWLLVSPNVYSRIGMMIITVFLPTSIPLVLLA